MFCRFVRDFLYYFLTSLNRQSYLNIIYLFLIKIAHKIIKQVLTQTKKNKIENLDKTC